MLRLFDFWMKSSSEAKLSETQKAELNRRSKNIKKDIPSEWHRKLRPTIELYDS